MKNQINFFVRVLFVIGFIFTTALPPQSLAYAASDLTITPNTWNVIGLDSNAPATGPYRFPIGAKICTSGAATTATVNFVWDDGLNPYSGSSSINLRSGSLSTLSVALPAAGCADAFFEVEVNRVSASFDTTRLYHITADDGTGLVSTPQPRQLYVEHLISQNRNSVSGVDLNGTPVAAGGTMNLMVGNTYTITLHGGTATQGYNQFEDFINFPNTIFQILSVKTSYSADSNTSHVPNPNSGLYANACIWDNDPNSPTYNTCIGGDDKAGGHTVTTDYKVKIISGGGTSQTLNTLLYDFSGSSFHYNSDFSTSSRIALIVDSSVVTINKSFNPKAIAPGGTSTMTITLSNPTTAAFTGVNFSDTFPTSPAAMTLANGTSTNTCGGSVTNLSSGALAAGDTGIQLSGGTISANSTCTITVTVTVPSTGTYNNTTGHLFISNTLDTGNFGSDSLVAATASACTPGQTLANWTIPVGTTANPPDLTGGIPATKASNVATATALASIPANTSIVTTGGSNDTTAWSTWGYKNAGQYVSFVVDTSKYSGVSMSFYVKSDGVSVGPTSMVVSYNNGAGFTNILTITNPAAAYTLHTIDFTGLTNTAGNTTFRISGSGANNDNSGAGASFDDIKFTGCSVPAPAPTISKSFSPNPIIKGANTTLTFTLNNTATGNQALTGVAFNDVLPAGLSIADSSTTQCTTGTLTTTASTRTIALTGGSLSAGGSCTFNVTVTGTSAGQYNNVTGFVSSTQTGTTTSYATAPLTVIAPPVLAKSFSPTSIFTGGTSTLTFQITNPNLSSSLSGVSFTDTLPAGITVATSGPSASCGGGSLTTTSPSTISYSGGSFSANTNCSFNVTVTGITAGTWNNQTSAITSTEGGPGNKATASIVVADQTASIDLNKEVSTDGTNWYKFVGQTNPGPVYYRFVVYNSGDLPFSNISISDPTLSGGPADPASCVWTSYLPLNSGDTAICAPASSITASSTPGTYTNTATVTGTYASGTKTSTSTAKYATPGLTIVKNVTESYFKVAGDTLNYSYTVQNTGFVSLLGPVTVTDDKVGAVTCQDPTAVGDLDSYLDPGETVTCPASGTIPYVVTSTDVTNKLVTNNAYATVSGVKSNTATKTVPLASDLTITKSNDVSGSVLLGNTFNWTLTVSNSASAGTATFTSPQTILVDDLPTTGVTSYLVGSVTPSGGTTGTINCSITTNTLTCTAGTTVTIPSGGSFSVPVTVTPSTTGTLTNPKSGGSCKVDPGSVVTESNESNNDCTPNVVSVIVPSLGLSKTDGVTFVVAGGTTTYTLTVSNTGTAATSGTITVVDVLPSGMSVSDGTQTLGGTNKADWSCSSTSNVITCTSNVAIAATSGTSVFSFPVNVDISASGTLTNKAQVGGGGDPNNPNPPTGTTAGQCTGTDTPNKGCGIDTDTVAAPALTIVKSETSSGPYAVGDTVNYSIVVTNTGNVTLHNVNVTDPAATLGTCSTTAGTVTMPLASLAVADKVTCAVSYVVKQADVDNGSFTNIGYVTDDNVCPDSSVSGCNSTVKVTFTPHPALTIVKSETSSGPYAVGDTVNYSIVVTNTGNVTLHNVNVTDNAATLGTCTPSIPVTDLGVGAKVTCSASHVLTKTDGDNGSFANTASVTDNTVCPAAGTSVCDSKVTVTVTPPGVAGILVEKSVTNVTFVGVSVINMTYQIKVTNTGTVTLSNVQVVDDLKLTYPSPATFTVKQVTSPVFQVNTAYNGDSKTNLLKGTDSLASGAFGTISLTVQVNTGGDAKNYTNTAVGSGLPPVGSKVEGTGTATGPKYIDPAITKAVDPTQAAVGDTVTFTLTVTNNGNWPATGVVVQDPLPGIFDYVSATSIDANTSLPRGTVSLITPRTVRVAIGNLAVTDKIIITITTKVNSLGQPPIENKATVSADPPPSGVSPDPIANDSSAVNITIGSNTTSLPSTGFAPNMTTVLAPQPADKAYSNNGDVWIEIPRLGISMPVVGVPHVNGSWDVSWLNNQAGWLQGTAFPSWSGNSVLTGHVYLANGQPGPFVNLSSLRWGDQIIAHIYGVSYVYEVRNNQVLSLNDTSVLSHKDVPWMTLLTCKDFDPATNSYLHRVAISAVLIDNSTSVDRSDR